MKGWLCVFVSLLIHLISSTPEDSSENVRQSRQIEKECCPCPKTVDPGVLGNIDQSPDETAGRVAFLPPTASVVDCPCLPKDVDSFASDATSRSRNFRPITSSSLLKDDPKPLLHPEVGLASSVLRTLHEATDEEYRDALARKEERNAANAKESDPGKEGESTRNHVTIFLSDPKASDLDSDMGAEETNVQETSCVVPPIEKEMPLITTEKPSLLIDILKPLRERTKSIFNKDSSFATNDLQENIDNMKFSKIPKLKNHQQPLKDKEISMKHNIPNVKLSNILDRLSEPLNKKADVNKTSALDEHIEFVPKVNELTNLDKNENSESDILNQNCSISDNDFASSNVKEDAQIISSLEEETSRLTPLLDLSTKTPLTLLKDADNLRQISRQNLANKIQESNQRLTKILKDALKINKLETINKKVNTNEKVDPTTIKETFSMPSEISVAENMAKSKEVSLNESNIDTISKDSENITCFDPKSTSDSIASIEVPIIDVDQTSVLSDSDSASTNVHQDIDSQVDVDTEFPNTFNTNKVFPVKLSNESIDITEIENQPDEITVPDIFAEEKLVPNDFHEDIARTSGEDLNDSNVILPTSDIDIDELPDDDTNKESISINEDGVIEEIETPFINIDNDQNISEIESVEPHEDTMNNFSILPNLEDNDSPSTETTINGSIVSDNKDLSTSSSDIRNIKIQKNVCSDDNKSNAVSSETKVAEKQSTVKPNVIVSLNKTALASDIDDDTKKLCVTHNDLQNMSNTLLETSMKNNKTKQTEKCLIKNDNKDSSAIEADLSGNSNNLLDDAQPLAEKSLTIDEFINNNDQNESICHNDNTNESTSQKLQVDAMTEASQPIATTLFHPMFSKTPNIHTEKPLTTDKLNNSEQKENICHNDNIKKSITQKQRGDAMTQASEPIANTLVHPSFSKTPKIHTEKPLTKDKLKNSEQKENICHNDNIKESISQKLQGDAMTQASEPIANTLFQPTFSKTFNKLKQKNLFHNNLIVQPESLMARRNGFESTTPLDINNLLGGDLKIPTVVDIREKVADFLNLNNFGVPSARSMLSASESRQMKAAAKAPTWGLSTPTIIPGLKRNILQDTLDNPLSGINLDIFKLRSKLDRNVPSLFQPSSTLSSLRANIPQLKNLQLKPLKLQSTINDEGNIFQTSLTFNEKNKNVKSRNTKKTLQPAGTENRAMLRNINNIKDFTKTAILRKPKLNNGDSQTLVNIKERPNKLRENNISINGVTTVPPNVPDKSSSIVKLLSKQNFKPSDRETNPIDNLNIQSQHRLANDLRGTSNHNNRLKDIDSKTKAAVINALDNTQTPKLRLTKVIPKDNDKNPTRKMVLKSMEPLRSTESIISNVEPRVPVKTSVNTHTLKDLLDKSLANLKSTADKVTIDKNLPTKIFQFSEQLKTPQIKSLKVKHENKKTTLPSNLKLGHGRNDKSVKQLGSLIEKEVKKKNFSSDMRQKPSIQKQVNELNQKLIIPNSKQDKESVYKSDRDNTINPRLTNSQRSKITKSSSKTPTKARIPSFRTSLASTPHHLLRRPTLLNKNNLPKLRGGFSRDLLSSADTLKPREIIVPQTSGLGSYKNTELKSDLMKIPQTLRSIIDEDTISKKSNDMITDEPRAYSRLRERIESYRNILYPKQNVFKDKEQNSDGEASENIQTWIDKPGSISLLSSTPRPSLNNNLLNLRNSIRTSLVKANERMSPSNDPLSLGEEEPIETQKVADKDCEPLEVVEPLVSNEGARVNSNQPKESKINLKPEVSPFLAKLKGSLKTSRVTSAVSSEDGKTGKTDMSNAASDVLPTSLCMSGGSTGENVAYKCKLICTREND